MPAYNDAPEVLLVDDKPDELRLLSSLVEKLGNRCRVLSPGDVAKRDLTSADLVLVDLTLEAWLNGLPEEPLSCRPPNGIALASVFRQYSDQFKSEPPTGYALITGQGEFFSQLPSERRPHVISRLSNFEWFFEKKADAADTARRIAELAKAIRSLPPTVKGELADSKGLLRYLNVSADSPLFDRYQDSIVRCRPPLHHLSERSHGLVIIRWLLHRILPHTCFLFDALNLAARLRVTPESLEKCLAENQQISAELNALKYTGPLAGFDGSRWWRGGVEQWLWDKTTGESASGEAIHRYLSSLGSPSVVPVNLAQPVVTVDKNLLPLKTFSSFADTKARRLDDWPDYAEPAYITTETLEQNPEMAVYISDLS